MRKGLIREASQILDDGVFMAGAYPPNERVELKKRRKAVKKEVIEALQKLSDLEKTSGVQQ